MREKIVGEKITLERAQYNEQMAKELFRVIDKCRNEFFPWLGWVKFTNSEKDTLEFLERVNKDWDVGAQCVYGIYTKDVFVGLISIINISEKNKKAEIGYWLDTDYTGKGIVSEAVKLIEKELFENDFNRIVIHTDVLNLKSAAVAKRLGYVHEGVLRQEIYSVSLGKFRDQNVFSKLKSDLLKKEHQ